MSVQVKDEILELGETFVTLLKSPICPPEVRTAIIKHLDHVRQQLDMTNPELVRSVFSFLATTSTLSHQRLAEDETALQAQRYATAAALNASASTEAATVAAAAAAPLAVKVEEPVPVAATASQIKTPVPPPAQPVPATIMTPETPKPSNVNLASRLSASADDRDDILG